MTLNIKEKPGSWILAASTLPHKGDSYLRIVLVEFESEFVTWMYNVETSGYSHGHYFVFTKDDYEDKRLLAFRDFADRLKGLCPIAGRS